MPTARPKGPALGAGAGAGRRRRLRHRPEVATTHPDGVVVCGAAIMTWACDDCGGQTSGGPMLRNKVWATIACKLVPVPCNPEEPFLFPLFRYTPDAFLCFGCIERRLGRQLTQEDVDTCEWWNVPWRWRDLPPARGSEATWRMKMEMDN